MKIAVKFYKIYFTASFWKDPLSSPCSDPPKKIKKFRNRTRAFRFSVVKYSRNPLQVKKLVAVNDRLRPLTAKTF